MKLVYMTEIPSDKKAILCVENYFFDAFKMEIENIINAEDREEKIKERLEIIFPKYNEENYILKYEILEKNKTAEKLIVYILNFDRLKSEMLEPDFKNFISLIPSFFICREFKENSNFINFDISEEKIFITKYQNKNIEEVESFYLNAKQNEKDGLIFCENLIETYFKNLQKDDFSLVLTGKKEMIKNISTDFSHTFLEVKDLNFRKYLNFLPSEYRKKLFFYYLNLKYLIFFLFLTLITLISIIFLNLKINKTDKTLNQLEKNIAILEEKNENIRSEIENINKEMENFKTLQEESRDKNFKISSLMKDLSANFSENIKIEKIEFSDKKIINITAVARNSQDYVNLYNNLLKNKNFELLNSDYLKNKFEKNYNFEFNLEVKYFEDRGEEIE